MYFSGVPGILASVVAMPTLNPIHYTNQSRLQAAIVTILQHTQQQDCCATEKQLHE